MLRRLGLTQTGVVSELELLKAEQRKAELDEAYVLVKKAKNPKKKIDELATKFDDPVKYRWFVDAMAEVEAICPPVERSPWAIVGKV